MGTKAHKPTNPAPADPGPLDADEEGRAAGPGVRPGTRSRILEARKRKAERDG